MNMNIYAEAVQNSACAFAYHEAVFDDNNKMIDYIFLDVNRSFEQMTGLCKERIVNKRFVQDIAQDKASALKWVEIYEKVLMDNQVTEFEEHSAEYDKYFYIRAYSPEKNHFVTLFNDRTSEKKILEISKYLLKGLGSQSDYEKIAQLAYNLSGARFVAFNLFREGGKDFTTVALCGVPEHLKKGLELLKFEVVGKVWPYDHRKEQRTRDGDITYFESLTDLSADAVPKQITRRIEKMFDLGKIVVAKIKKEEKVLGDFTFFLDKGSFLNNQDILMIYMSQLGLFIEKNRLDAALRENQKLFYSLAEHAPIGFISCNTAGEITYANTKLLEIMGSPSIEETKRVNLFEFSKLRESGFSDKLKECIENDRFITFEIGYSSAWGKYAWIRAHFTPAKENETVTGANIIIDDITEMKKHKDDLIEKAQRDPLTNAYNWNAFDTLLPERIRKSGEEELISCLAVVDVDNFKSINDNYGHKTGDNVLKYLAARIRDELRESDLIIRTGGDEFVIYLHNCGGPENADRFIKRIFDKISSKYRISNGEAEGQFSLDVGCSIGVSFFPKDGSNEDALMIKADEALYKVKRSGKAAYLIA